MMYENKYEKKNCNLAVPLICESTDMDGKWILVSIQKYLGAGKWLGYDEDGETVVVDSRTLSNPQI
jgi:hypothetical protein